MTIPTQATEPSKIPAGLDAARGTRRVTWARALATALALGVAIVGAGAQRAEAATTCAHSVPGLLEVHAGANGDFALLRVDAGTIKVGGLTGPVSCSGSAATTTTIDTVLVVDDSDNPVTPAPSDGRTFVSINEPGTFAPGKTPEATGVSEIEFLVDPKAGDEDELIMEGDAAQVLVAGNGGVSWTNDDDADVLGMPYDTLSLGGGLGQDYLSGRGAHGTGAPLSTAFLVLNGGGGVDNLYGGDFPGGDALNADEGADNLVGYGGDDDLEPGPGDDTLQGGSGQDTVDYDDAAAGVRVDLANTQAQDTGQGVDSIAEIENVTGSEFSDTLTGDASANVFDANDGDDTLDGRGGADEMRGEDGLDTVSYASAPAGVAIDLSLVLQPGDGDQLVSIEALTGSAFADALTGNSAANRINPGSGADTVSSGAGADTIAVRDGEGDRVDCGADADAVTSDRRTLDTLTGCEAIDALPELPGGGTGDGPGADNALSFTLSAARRQRVLRQRGIRIALHCKQEPCSANVSATATLRRGTRRVRLVLRRATTSVVADTSRSLRLRLTRRQGRALRGAIRTGQRPVFKVRANARDAAGNSQSRTLRVRSTG